MYYFSIPLFSNDNSMDVKRKPKLLMCLEGIIAFILSKPLPTPSICDLASRTCSKPLIHKPCKAETNINKILA